MASFGYRGNVLPAGLTVITSGFGWFAVNVTPLAPPIGRQADPPTVVSAPLLRERLDAISVG